MSLPEENTPAPEPLATRAQELRVFLFLTVLLAPIVAVAIVGIYGLSIWLYQLFTGPPAF